MRKQSDYKRSISQYIPLENRYIFFYWKGRVALYALLKAIGVGEDDEVVMPGLTCVVVPNAVLYLKAKPIYVDVEIKTCNPSLEAIQSAVNEKTKVIIVQNTFGLSTDVDRISQWARSKGLFTIEDCTHGFGGTHKGKPNGLYCDAAVYSTQWNKPFSTGVGGFSIVNNVLLVNKVFQVNKDLVSPSFFESMQLNALILLNKLFLTNATYWFLLSLYRKLSRAGLVVGSSSRNEITGISMPRDYFKATSMVQLKEGIAGLKKLSSALILRKKNAQLYTEFLSKHGKYHVAESLHDDHSFLKYPILVRNRSKFIMKAEKAHIKMGDWFTSVLHPVTPPFTPWCLDLHYLPKASFLAKHLVNLPTDLDRIEDVITFLNINIEDLLDDGAISE